MAKPPEKNNPQKTSNDKQVSVTHEFARQAEEAPPGLVAEFWDFLIHNKKWWLTPIIIVILLMGAIIFLGGTAAAPFIYPLF